MMFMESLWLQKIRLRVPNILLAYGTPTIKKIVGEEGTTKLEEKFRLFNVEKTTLSDGSKGTLGIQLMPKEQMNDRAALKMDVEAEEENNFQAGNPYEKVILPYGYLDNISFDIEIITNSLWQSSQSLNMAMALEKTQMIAKMFPEYFASNKEVLFRDILKAYGDDVNKYDLPQPMNFEEEQGLALAQGQAGKSKGGGSSAGGGMISDMTGNGTNPTNDGVG